MGLLDIFKKSPAAVQVDPYQNPALNKIYNLLFCDNIELFQFDGSEKIYPWNILLAAQPDITALQSITTDVNLETRAKIIAHKRLRELKVPAGEKELLAVILEVGLEKGLDTLAVFRDGTARLIHHSETMLVWDTRTPISNQLVGQLFTDSLTLLKSLDLYKAKRKPRPAFGMVRLSFISSSGLFFKEGPFNKLEKDPKDGPVIFSATRIMSFLIQQKNNTPAS